jgi:hypothetical protein
MFKRTVRTTFQAQDLVQPTSSGSANVQVPNSGWFIFGGDGNEKTK